MCAHTLANTTEAWAVGKRTCTKNCPGNKSQKCGHTGRLDVWKTGLVSESSGLVLTTESAWLNVFVLGEVLAGKWEIIHYNRRKWEIIHYT